VSLNPSRPFILRPIATSLLMAAILIAGGIGYLQLPVSALPEVDYPIIQVLTFYPGAGPEVMSSSVTAPLERQFGQMPGLKQMTSVSSGGGSVVTLEFNLDEDIDVAEQEVQAAINAGNSFLPTDLPNPPVYSKVNPADAPIMTLALTSDSLPLDKIGIPNGLLKATNVFKITNVKDPVTGRDRVISGARPQDIELTLTQDINSLRSTWGVYYYNCWDEHYYRLTQVRHRRVIPPFFEAWWEYKPEESLSLRFELDNFGRFVYDDQFFNYTGPRDKAPLSSIEEIHIKSQPRLFFEIRKTFGD